MARLVAETIGFVLQVDRGGFQRGIARGRLTLPLHQPVRLERQIRVSPVDVIQVFYKYGRLLRCCRTCSMINQGGEMCPTETEENPRMLEDPVPTVTAPPMVFWANSSKTLTACTSFASLSALFPKEKRPTQIRAVPKFPSPAKIAEVRRDKDKEERTNGKHAQHALVLVPLPLNPKEMGFTISDGGAP